MIVNVGFVHVTLFLNTEKSKCNTNATGPGWGGHTIWVAPHPPVHPPPRCTDVNGEFGEIDSVNPGLQLWWQ
jgi:hypothetical protein